MQSALLVEDRCDLLVAGVRGELADQLDGVLAGAVALRTATDQRNGQLGARAAFPDDLDVRPPRLLGDSDDYLADERAQQLLAVPRRGRLGCPQLRQVTREPRESGSFAGGQRFGAARLELGELAPLAFLLGQRLLEASFERSGDEPVLRLAGIELALRPLGFELGALEREPLPAQPVFVRAFELADRLGAGPDPGGCDSFEERSGNRLLQARAAERLAGVFGAVEVVRADARIPDRVAVGAGVRDLHPPRRSGRSGECLAAARRPRGRRRRLGRVVSRCAAIARGWRGTRPR